MTVRLTVDGAAWRHHVESFAARVEGLVPVVKGNGYGFGLTALAAEATRLAPMTVGTVAVGTVHEARTASPSLADAHVALLTPLASATPSIPNRSIPTVGAIAHVAALAASGWKGPVALKLASSMHRYGTHEEQLADLAAAVRLAGMEVVTHIVHPPLITDTYTVSDAQAEIESWLPALDPHLPLSVSHLPAESFAALQRRHPRRQFTLRVGTALWHGDKSFLRLQADVVDVRPVTAATRAGYRLGPVPGDGTLVMVGAGTAHGLLRLTGGRSPFHHARRRLPLVDAPHMHTSIAFVAKGDPCPCVGEWVDLQHPLTTTTVDEIAWL